MKIKWRELFKFLSGAAFAGSVANFYLWLTGIAVPFFGYTISPSLLGARSILQFLLFVIFFYCGWFAMTSKAPPDEIVRLRQHLERLVGVWDRVFSGRIPYDASDMAVMA